ncbi:hypothetical protein Dimus_038308 [Dionaea muscipula]
MVSEPQHRHSYATMVTPIHSSSTSSTSSRFTSVTFIHSISVRLNDNIFFPSKHQVLSTIRDRILTQMVESETTAQIWSTQNAYFSATNKAKISQFKTQLRNIHKDSLLVNAYLLKGDSG